jgi:PRTRC genetic system protein C
MAIRITNLERVFIFKKGKETINLPDPNTSLSALEVCKFYGATHPELTTANVEGPTIVKDKANYTFTTQAGRLG